MSAANAVTAQMSNVRQTLQMEMMSRNMQAQQSIVSMLEQSALKTDEYIPSPQTVQPAATYEKP